MPRKTQIREYAKGLTLFDDVLFWKASEDKDFCEEIVRVFLDDESLKVLTNKPQEQFNNLQGRSIYVDLLCELQNKKIVNVEIQKTDNVKHVRRVRYHSSILTTNITDPGEKFENIPDVIVIYVAMFDIFHKGDCKYVLQTTLEKYGDVIDDGLQRIFINGTVDDGTKLAKLMRVFKGDMTYIEEFPKTRSRIVTFTKKEEEVEKMSKFIEQVIAEELKNAEEAGELRGEQRGKLEGKSEEKVRLCTWFLEMIEKNYTNEDMRNCVNEELQKTPDRPTL